MNIRRIKRILIFAIASTLSLLTISCQMSLNTIQATNSISTSKDNESSKYTSDTTPTPTPTPTPISVPSQNPDVESPKKANLIPYKGKITHIFFHPLLAYHEMAFDGDSQSKGFDDWFVTVSEFNKIINSLYQKNYILVDMNSLYNIKTEDGKTCISKKVLMLPENKKPLILSIDDMNYYKYMIGNGTVSKLILDSKGAIATYSINTKGEKIVSYENEIVPILDEFVKQHPDFSLNGAKGTIALTGYEGVLGYRTDFDTRNNASERTEALKIITRLKETGWNFACHGYGHLDAKKQPYNVIVRDTLKWKKEVESLIGPTQIYIYPFGSSVKPDDPKFKFLLDSGFIVLCGVGPNLNEHVYSNSVTMDRRHIDGISLRYQRSMYLDLFDSKDVLDTARPLINK